MLTPEHKFLRINSKKQNDEAKRTFGVLTCVSKVLPGNTACSQLRGNSAGLTAGSRLTIVFSSRFFNLISDLLT